MERDFLGINLRDSGEFVKEGSNSSRQDSASVGSSAAQWPFSSNITNLQHLMSVKTVQEAKPQKAAFDHLSSSVFQPVATSFESSHKASPVKDTAQKCFSLDMQGGRQFFAHPHRPQSSDNLGASTHRPSIPVPMSSPFFKIHGSSGGANLPLTPFKQQPFVGFPANSTNYVGSTVGTFVPRNAPKPTNSSQLTIFYAGTVNVFDDVPLDKAHAIMLLASKICSANSTPNTSSQRSEAPVPTMIPKPLGVSNSNSIQTPAQTKTQIQIQNKLHAFEERRGNKTHVSSPMSVTSHIVAHSRNNTSNTNEAEGPKSVGLLSQTSNAATNSAPPLPRAVPQARKASLARFLEKRKERVTSVLPYSCEKKSPETSTTFEGGQVLTKSLSADLSLSSNREDSWCSVHPKSNTQSKEPPIVLR